MCRYTSRFLLVAISTVYKEIDIASIASATRHVLFSAVDPTRFAHEYEVMLL